MAHLTPDHHDRNNDTDPASASRDANASSNPPPVHESGSFEQSLEQIVQLHKAGVAGDKNAVQQAHQLLEQLRRIHPNQPLADAYHGSIMILIARDKTKPLDKLRWCKRGLALLDSAVAADPHHNTIRILRGKAAYKLPEKHFRRATTAIEDYTYLINQEQAHSGTLEKDEYLLLIYELGDACYRIGRNRDAASHWVKLKEEPQYRARIQPLLQALEGKPAVEAVQTNDFPILPILIGIVASAVGKTLVNWVELEERKARHNSLKKGLKTQKVIV